MTPKSLIPAWFKTLILASMLIIGYGLTHPSQTNRSMQPADPKVAPTASELFDILWMDKYPEVQHDTWKAYLFTSDNIGVSVDALSAFKLTLEVFEFKADKARLTFHFPHDGRRANCAYKIEKLKKPTRHFDTQLTIENDPQIGGQTHVYFTGPEFRNLETMPSHIREALESNQTVHHSLGRK